MTIEHLCLTGGGPNGYITYGALKILNKNNFWNIHNIKSIYGTSMGAIIGVLLTLNIEWDILDDYIIKRPWNKIFSISTDDIFKYTENKGVFDINVLRISLEYLFKFKNIDININLLDYYNLTNIELNIISCDINSFTEYNLNHINNPQLKLIDALYRSSTIPFIFKPQIENNVCFLDGGIFNNFPVNYLLNKNIETNTILAINNIVNIDETNQLLNIAEDHNVFHFFYKFSRKLINTLLEKNNPSNKNIKLPYVLSIKTYNWTLEYLQNIVSNHELRLELVNSGEKQGLDFYNTDCKN